MTTATVCVRMHVSVCTCVNLIEFIIILMNRHLVAVTLHPFISPECKMFVFMQFIKLDTTDRYALIALDPLCWDHASWPVPQIESLFKEISIPIATAPRGAAGALGFAALCCSGNL